MFTKQYVIKSLKGAALAVALLLAAAASTQSLAMVRHTRSHARHAYMHKAMWRRHAANALVAGSRQTPPDSYLKYKVYSVSDIVKELSANPRLVHYYAKTWGKSDSYVLHYISNYVQESYIPETKYYTVYCVRPNGLVYPTKQKMAQGTKVFALKNGEPIMKWLCGNPLSNYLQVVYPAPPAKVKDVVQILPEQSEQEVVPSETPVIAPATPVHVLPTAATRIITSAGSHSISPAYLALAAVPFLHANHPGGSSPTSLPLGPSLPSSPTSPGSPLAPGAPTSPTFPGLPLAPGAPTSPTSPGYPLAPGVPTSPTSPTAVPELGSGAAIALGMIPIALLAWLASVRRKASNS